MISVIIPLYNKEPIIKQSLQSVLSQDYDDFEVVVVNDGSTDKSAEIVRSIKDSRIRLIEQENGGPSKARNVGVANAKGDYVVTIDADDELAENALQFFSSYSQEHPEADMLLGEVCMQYRDKRYIKQKYKEGFLQDNFKARYHKQIVPCSGTVMYKKEILLSNPLDENLRRYEDLERLLRLFRFAKIFLIPKVVSIVNCDYASASIARKDIDEDFLGHIDMQGKKFWERMCLYRLFYQEHTHYPKETRQLYPKLYYRYDLKVFTMFVDIVLSNPSLSKIWLKIIGL